MKPFLAALLLSALVGGSQVNGCGTPTAVENAICSATAGSIGSWAHYNCNNGYILYGRNRILCTKNGWTKPSFYCQKTKDEVALDDEERKGEMMLGDEAQSQPSSKSPETKDEMMLGDEAQSRPSSKSPETKDEMTNEDEAPSQPSSKSPETKDEMMLGDEAQSRPSSKSPERKGEMMLGDEAQSQPSSKSPETKDEVTFDDEDEMMLGDEAPSQPSSKSPEINDEMMLGDEARSQPSSKSPEIQCDQPPPISNGRVTEKEEWKYGDNASYSCDEGYILTGEETIHCTDTGAWSHPPPTCTEIKCCRPLPISNGRVTEGEEWTYGAEASYSCDEGYNLTGQETIHCTDTGDWSHSPPNCTVISCGTPPNLENAISGVSGYTFGNWAFYTCNKGYSLYGRNGIQCTENGWSKSSLSCQKIKCCRPLPISNGRVTEGEEWTYRAEATYSCDEGYNLTGQQTIHCTDTGDWSHPPPVCTVISCGTPPDLENAKSIVSGYTFGNWTFYTCNKGYIPRESHRILCTKNGWTNCLLSCQKIQCDQPPPISNGRVTEGEEWTYGAEANYSCDEGYNLTGQETIHCTDTGAWSHPPPVCTVISCGTPPNLENAKSIVSGHTFGNWTFYTCNKGYIPRESKRILCTKNGWTTCLLSCQKTKCCRPLPISNGRVTEGEEWTYRAEATYSCDEGYTLTGQETIQCMDIGAWSHPPPVCTDTFGIHNAAVQEPEEDSTWKWIVVSGSILGVVIVLIIILLILRCRKQGSYRIPLNNEEADSLRKLTLD